MSYDIHGTPWYLARECPLCGRRHSAHPDAPATGECVYCKQTVEYIVVGWSDTILGTHVRMQPMDTCPDVSRRPKPA